MKTVVGEPEDALDQQLNFHLLLHLKSGRKKANVQNQDLSGSHG